ncbi:MAG: DNA polymerase III subunit gamma/tau [Elusimicrobia bacterium]|nr:DNA polymerase III subunit gamma/tau [Elusimicrobiota bacterium]
MKKSPHLALALKHRPQLFEEIAAQESVSTTLQNAVESGRIAHAYLFFGPKGIGKTTTARILAKALNCKDGPTPKPCGKCPACAEIAAGSCIDVLELDAASHTQVDKIREMIIETIALAPSRDRYKVFIIDEVHMLSGGSFNALLKTIEEPPPHAVFILATTELAKIPGTILSRCQRFRFRPPSREAIATYLQRIAQMEKLAVEPEALSLLARAAGGALRDAISLLEQAASFADGKVTREKAADLLGMLPEEMALGFAKAVLEKDSKALCGWLDVLTAEGFDPSQLLRDLRERFQELYLDLLGARKLEDPGWKSLGEGRSPETFSFLIKRLNRALEEIRQSDNPQVAFELGLFSLLEAPYDLVQWVARLEALEKRLGAAPQIERKGHGCAAPAPAEAVRDSAPTKAAQAAGEAWPEFLRRLHDAKPALGHAFDSARLASSEGGEWRVVFDNGFKLERAKKEQPFLEQQLSSAAGRALKLKFEVAQAPPRKPAEKEEEVWLDTSSPEAPADQGIKLLLEKFGGRIRQAKKK